jgi:hypothetical protein
MLTGFAIYQLPSVLIFKSNLTRVQGTLRTADTYVTTVIDRRGHESRKAELIFYLNERKQKFYLVENIDKKWRNEKYENILRGLKRAETITVWIKKSEMNDYQPEVFQIDDEKGTLLDFEVVREQKAPLVAFMLLLGIGSISVFLWFRFPGKFNKIVGTNKHRSSN